MKPITIRKILVPVDFSRGSLSALRMASAIARRHEASLHLLHVTDNDYNLFDTDKSLDPMKFKERIKKLGDLAKTVINEHQLHCFYTSEYGNVTHSILKSAVDMHADLIVMGKNGNNGYFAEYAGTQTCQVAEKSRIPVLIMPEEVDRLDFRNILFPVRPLLSVTAKYEAIRPLILENASVVTLLNMRDPKEEDQLHIIHQLSMKIRKRMEDDCTGYKVEYYFKDNCFADEVLKMITDREREFDAVIITSEAHIERDDFRFGYYEKKIIHQCNIPLFLLHGGEPYLETADVLTRLVTETGVL